VLTSKIKLFNEFLSLYPGGLAGFRMWHFTDGVRSQDYPVCAIPPERVVPGTFIFLGSRQPLANPDLKTVLSDFDCLLELYRFVEGDGDLGASSDPGPTNFAFKAGCTAKAGYTNATPTQRTLDVDLRHNRLQERLHAALVATHGADNVGTEVPSGAGNNVDVMVRTTDGYWFYEIKTETTARACIRQALGQILEYAYWPGNQGACRLVIAGEPILDAAGTVYLEKLREDFKLPLAYFPLPALE